MAEKEYIITLVRSAQSGDSASFAELYNLYYQKVFAFIRTIVRNSEDAEDILQLTFLNAWRNLDQLSDPAAFNTWIQVIARNLSTSHLRKKNFVLLLDAEKDDTPVDIEDTELLLPEVYAEQEDLNRRLGKIIDSLSDVQRQTVMLFYFDQLSVEEIAQVMECSTGTVKSRLFLARKTIRTEIEEQERKSGQKFYGIAGIDLCPSGRGLLAAILYRWQHPGAHQLHHRTGGDKRGTKRRSHRGRQRIVCSRNYGGDGGKRGDRGYNEGRDLFGHKDSGRSPGGGCDWRRGLADLPPAS